MRKNKAFLLPVWKIIPPTVKEETKMLMGFRERVMGTPPGATFLAAATPQLYLLVLRAVETHSSSYPRMEMIVWYV